MLALLSEYNELCNQAKLLYSRSWSMPWALFTVSSRSCLWTSEYRETLLLSRDHCLSDEGLAWLKCFVLLPTTPSFKTHTHIYFCLIISTLVKVIVIKIDNRSEIE